MTEALVVIDLQRDYFADGELERCRDDLVATTNGLAAAARAGGVPVLEVRTEHDPGGSTWTISMHEDGGGPVMAGTEGVEPVPGLDLGPDVPVVTKTRDSAFFGTDLADRLRDLGVDHVVLAGVSTESCIVGTAVDAFAHDLAVTLVSDATASIEWSLHDEALQRARKQYRQDVATAAEVAGRWRDDAGRGPQG
ncbi:cysteine hydrolase family protein [Nocardioides litoris]|uniref:cysteine hydrolase family protein n=1 Tax=Nocardioides litoris TaxID=1926648 RepID=UPI00111F28F9|nr:isochorismatase family cysteine hydrolase [Nocardioides litoris]